MKLQRLITAGVFGLSTLAMSTAAHADIWAFSYTGVGVTASGTFTTAGSALVPENILSISGTRNGAAITGLVPVGVDPDFLYDNQFTRISPNFTDGGMLFSVVGVGSNVNVYFFETGYFDLAINGLNVVETPITWTVTAVPEPATVLSMMAGLGLLGVYMRKARASV